MDTKPTKRASEHVPYVLGGAFVVLFLLLCGWQISRGLEKEEAQRDFDAESGYATWTDGMETRPFQQLKVTGHYDNNRQLLLENIVRKARQGYYVITPLRISDDEPLLLVNRGWIAKTSTESPNVDVPEQRLTIRGRAGRLPRAAMQMGEPVTAGTWPRRAVFPDYDDVAAVLAEPVQPFVLLLDAEEAHGYERDWQPVKFGPGRHYGYAFQWFAMALVLSGLLAWNYRRRGFERD